MAETGRYLYAVTRPVSTADLSATAGINDRPLRVVEADGLAAVVSDVDLDEFGEDGLREHLEDLAWLEQVARRHDAVVQHVARLGATAPLRLATICLDDEGVRDRLREWSDALTQALDRVQGRSEWSVKLYLPASAAGQAVDRQPGEDESTSRGAGAEYLRRKRAQSDGRRASEERATAIASEIHATLVERSVASRLLAPQDPRLTGHEGTMVMNAAYLVPTSDADGFVGAVEDLATTHPDVRVEAQGPWPPYSFASLEQP